MATSVPRTKRRNDLEESGEIATPCKKKTTSEGIWRLEVSKGLEELLENWSGLTWLLSNIRSRNNFP